MIENVSNAFLPWQNTENQFAMANANFACIFQKSVDKKTNHTVLTLKPFSKYYIFRIFHLSSVRIRWG
jgi:hypothetical protein